MAEQEITLNFTDITMAETDGVYEDVKELMSQDFTSDGKWMIRTNATVISKFGVGEVVLSLFNDKVIYIVDYEPSIADVYYNPDIPALSQWAQQSGWRIPQPNVDLIKMDKDFTVCELPVGFQVNHQRFDNTPLPDDFKSSFKLFWTSPSKKRYYDKVLLTHEFKLSKSLKGISLLTSPSDFELKFTSIPAYNNLHSQDAFKDMWYGILEDNLLKEKVKDPIYFINLYDVEIIFSSKSFIHLKSF